MGKNITGMLGDGILQINIERARIDSQKVDIVQLVPFFTKKIFDNSIMNTMVYPNFNRLQR